MRAVLMRSISAAIGCLVLASCAGQQPAQYSGLMSSPYLKKNERNDSGKIPYRYATTVDLSRYHSAILEPIGLYGGADNQFGKMSEESKGKLVQYAQAAFTRALSKRFTLVNNPEPDTARFKITLTGAAASTPVISTFAHFDIGGGLYDGVQAIRGKEGLMTGWVMYAVEVSDASSGQLLEAYEEKQYPSALNAFATFGSLAAAKTGIDKGSTALATHLQQP